MANLPDKANDVKLQEFVQENNTLKRVVKSNVKDKIELEIGDVLQPDFKPQFKLKKWDNEVNFSIRAEEHPSARVSSKDGIVKYSTPDYEVHLYEKEDAAEDGGFEFEWLLTKKPKTNVLRATIQQKGLVAHPQLPLSQFIVPKKGETVTETEYRDATGKILIFRPEHVVDSIAFYHEGGFVNYRNGTEYKTGKIAHSYRIVAVDDKGRSVYGKQKWDSDTGELLVTIPQDFIETVEWKKGGFIKVDPTIGYTSLGGTYNYGVGSYFNDQTAARYIPVTLTNAGTLVSITSGLNSTASTETVDICGIVYRKDSNGPNSHDFVASAETLEATITTTGAWHEIEAAGESLSADDYLIGVMTNGEDLVNSTIRIASDSVTSEPSYWDYTNGSGSYSTQKSADPLEPVTATGYAFSIYATYDGPVTTEKGLTYSVSSASAGEYQFLQATNDTSDSTTYTFASQNLGTAATDRVIVVGIGARKAGAATTISSVTIGGVSATIIQVSNSDTNSDIAGIAYATVPTGTTGDIVVTFGSGMVRCAIQAYRAVGLASTTPYDSGTSTASDPTFNLDIPVGFAVATALSNSESSCTWTGLTEDHDNTLETYVTVTSASDEFVSEETGRTITADFATSGTTPVGVFAAWEYAAGSSTTPVTKSLSYSVLATDSTTKSLGYNVTTTSSVTKSLGYDVLVSSSDTKPLQYFVHSTSSDSASLTYSIETLSSATKSLSYNVQSNSSVTKSLEYVISALGLSTKNLTFAVKSSQSSSLNVEYRLETSDSLTSSLQYEITSTSSLTKSLGYAIRSSASDTLSLSYDIETSVSSTSNLTYSIHSTSSVSSSLEYVISADNSLCTDQISFTFSSPSIVVEDELTYAVKTSSSVATSLQYDVLTANAEQKTLQYVVESPVSNTQDLTYRVLTSSLVSKSLSYVVLSTDSATKNLTYAIVSQSSDTKSLTYVVGGANILILSLEYTVETSSSVTSSLSYDVETTSSVQNSLTYSVRTSDSLTSSLSYEVETSTYTTKTLAYSISSVSELQESLTYEVQTSSAITSELQYIVAVQSSITKSLDYDVILQSALTVQLQYLVNTSSVITHDLMYELFSGSPYTKYCPQPYSSSDSPYSSMTSPYTPYPKNEDEC